MPAVVSRVARLVVLLCLVGTVSPARPALAQDGPRPAVPAEPRDVLFGRPRAEVGVRVGWNVARAQSDWYSFVTDQLTLNRRDFDGVAVAADVGVWLRGRSTLLFGVDVTNANAPSEYRRLVDNVRQPISQATHDTGVHTTAGLKYALTSRGRAIGRLTWLPRRVVPYVGAGGGLAYYHLRQSGDFVDFTDRSVFPANFESNGWSPTVYVGGGADVQVGRRLQITGDLRFRHATARLQQTWVDFEPLDLSGLRATVGVGWPF
jgi:hypothetical protein